MYTCAGIMAAPAEDNSQNPQYTADELVKLWSDYMIEGARYGDEEDVHEALKNAAKVDTQDEDGRTALHMAAANDYISIATVLLQAGANTEIKNASGNTALHWACVAGSSAMVDLLLAHGANPAALNAAGQAPIDGALDNDAVCTAFQLHSTAQGESPIIHASTSVGGNADVDPAGTGQDAQGRADPIDGVAEGLDDIQLN